MRNDNNQLSDTPKFANRLTQALNIILGLCVLTMLVLIFFNVVLRYGFNSGITVSEEISRIAFVWLIFIGSIVALQSKQHLGVNMIIEKFPISIQKGLHIVRQIVILVILYLVVSGSVSEVSTDFSNTLAVTGLPKATMSGVILVSAVAMALVLVIDLIKTIITPAIASNARQFRTSDSEIEE